MTALVPGTLDLAAHYTVAVEQPIEVKAEEHAAAEAVERDSLTVGDAARIAGTIIGIMAVGAAIVAMTVLSPGLVLLGFCVALLMMTFIGMPLILASIADARDARG